MEQLRIWHTGIVGFNVKYKNELTELKEFKRKGKDAEWDALFKRGKNEFNESVGGEDRVGLHVDPIPTSFSLEHIDKSAFDEDMRSASYPQFVGALYDCPSEIDGRS